MNKSESLAADLDVIIGALVKLRQQHLPDPAFEAAVRNRMSLVARGKAPQGETEMWETLYNALLDDSEVDVEY
jgi:hypothetical protein